MIRAQWRTTLSVLLLGSALLATAPALAQSPQGANPTRQSVTEEQLLQSLKGRENISGRVSIPDAKAAVLQQPEGREWRQFREGWLPWIGGIAVLGMLVALALFFFAKGRLALDGGVSGIKILRFNAFERFTHWLTAFSFVALALTGLNYIFGKRLILPLIGHDAFTTLSQYGKYTHNFLSWPFMLGVLFMLVVWVRDNIPDRTDVAWIKAAGGFLDGSHPPARRFNAGQKVIFWSVVLGGIAMSATGLILMFPFSALDIQGMQLAQIVHALVGVVLIAIILAHIYIGSIGMEGAYDAMGSGEVDLAWAKSHHSLWVEEEQARTAGGPQIGRGGAVPAE